MPNSPQYPDHIASLRSYVPGLPIEDLARRIAVAPSAIAKLASNENPLGPSPRAIEAMAAANIDCSRYPDNDCTDLVAALAARYDVPAEWIIVGAGSESVIGNAAASLLSPGRKTLYSQYSFQAYVNAAQRLGATSIVVPAPAFRVDLAAMQRLLSEEPSIVYIANPGNPTGTHLDPSELEAFLAAVPAHIVVVLDEAYFEYMPEAGRGDAIGWVRRHSNLLVTRTFSKAYGLAGLRVGFGIAQKTLADMLRRTRPPFTVSAAAQVGATAALLDDEFLARTMAENRASLKELCSGLDQMELRYLPSSTNFVLAQVGDGAAWTRALERHALIVRPVVAYGLPDWLRLSIGTAAEVKRLVRAMRSESDLLATSKARAA